MTNNDQLIINKILQGNTNAFAELVDTYKDLVFSLALKMTKNREEAEEVSQDTFIKAYKNLSKFKGDSKFSTWLYKITYHNCLDRFKKNEKHYKTDSIDTLLSFNVSSTDDILKSIEKQDRAAIMKACLDELPEEERTVLWFFYYKELSLKEIIEITQFSEANIKVKLHRGRKHLLAIVKEKFEPEMIAHYGKNKQHLQEDTFLKKYVQEIELDKPKAGFTASIMGVILAEEKQTFLKPTPLVSKKLAFISLGFVATCIWFLMKGESSSEIQFPKIDFSFIPKLEIPNLFSNLSISSTIMYAVITFSILFFIQIGYLKNHFEKKFE